MTTAAWSNGWVMALDSGEPIYLGPHRVIDPAWTWTDHAGHVHTGADLSATAVDVNVECWCELDAAPHDRFSHRECARCGQRLPEPGTVPGNEWLADPAGPTLTLSGTMPDGRWVRAVVPADERDELVRRITMTSTPSIQERIVTGWVAEHPEAIAEVRLGYR